MILLLVAVILEKKFIKLFESDDSGWIEEINEQISSIRRVQKLYYEQSKCGKTKFGVHR